MTRGVGGCLVVQSRTSARYNSLTRHHQRKVLGNLKGYGLKIPLLRQSYLIHLKFVVCINIRHQGYETSKVRFDLIELLKEIIGNHDVKLYIIG